MSYQPKCKFCGDRGFPRGCPACTKKSNNNSRPSTSGSSNTNPPLSRPKIRGMSGSGGSYYPPEPILGSGSRSKSQGQPDITKLHRDGKSGYPPTKLRRDGNSSSALPAPTNLHRDGSSSRPDSTKLHKDGTSQAPWSSKSIYKTDYDRKMASRQTKIHEMTEEQKEEQHAWAKSKQKENSATSCPVGYIWLEDGDRGYRCLAGGHFTTHKLVAEGLNGYYTGGVRIDGGPARPVRGPLYGPEMPHLNVGTDFWRQQIAQFGKAEPTEDMCPWTAGADGIAMLDTSRLPQAARIDVSAFLGSCQPRNARQDDGVFKRGPQAGLRDVSGLLGNLGNARQFGGVNRGGLPQAGLRDVSGVWGNPRNSRPDDGVFGRRR
jgi:hypothetical protein